LFQYALRDRSHADPHIGKVVVSRELWFKKTTD